MSSSGSGSGGGAGNTTRFLLARGLQSSSGSSSGSSSRAGPSIGADLVAGVPTPSPTPAETSTNSQTISVVAIVVISVGIVIVGIAVFMAVVWYRRIRKRHPRTSEVPQVLNAKSASYQIDTVTRLRGSVIGQNAMARNASSLWNDEELLSYHMRIEDLMDVRVIGSGGCGIVYLVKYRESRLLASKRLVRDQSTRQKSRALVAEIKLVAKLQHPCIVEFVGAAWTTESDLQALFEYMPNGDLRSYLDKTPQAPWDERKLIIAKDIVEALVYVHSFSPPLVHRDLKSRNVLLTEEMHGKLSDFGVSRYQSDNRTMTGGVGTSRWLAPEVINASGEYNHMCDIYSFGVLLSELDTHVIPFSDLRSPQGNPYPEVGILQLVSEGKLQPSFSASCPEYLVTLAKRCLSFDPSQRPSAIEIAYVLRTAGNAA
ncbi:hypothetical protein Poli38472_012402 [Pythium oligandrum]|uniref:Protein kinase domain-containing protein n=1 Tax=Pythium oligandrum TaxID=41045 RepID=A0A8K1CRD8_PYTOL|nr:hypothetical protein Poli38472_012402 [Pythium oligandrum]|eukprot:TMW67286.1 hypothetical protein Poli38472_012402 [Pythium oligandrum]